MSEEWEVGSRKPEIGSRRPEVKSGKQGVETRRQRLTSDFRLPTSSFWLFSLPWLIGFLGAGFYIRLVIGNVFELHIGIALGLIIEMR